MCRTKAINVKVFHLLGFTTFDIFDKKLASFYIHRLKGIFQGNVNLQFQRNDFNNVDFTY